MINIDKLPKCPYPKGSGEREGWVEMFLLTFNDVPDGAFAAVLA